MSERERARLALPCATALVTAFLCLAAARAAPPPLLHPFAAMRAAMQPSVKVFGSGTSRTSRSGHAVAGREFTPAMATPAFRDFGPAMGATPIHLSAQKPYVAGSAALGLLFGRSWVPDSGGEGYLYLVPSGSAFVHLNAGAGRTYYIDVAVSTFDPPVPGCQYEVRGPDGSTTTFSCKTGQHLIFGYQAGDSGSGDFVVANKIQDAYLTSVDIVSP